ncbi:hypothetical protein D3C81_2123980 [compost metagenome]
MRHRDIFHQVDLQLIRPLFTYAGLLDPRQTLDLLLDDVHILRHKGARCSQSQDRLANIVVSGEMAFTGQYQP